MSPKPWKIVSTTRDNSYRVFSLRKDRAVSPRTGEEHDFFILESTPWVNVIPLTSENEVVMVRQYRHGLQDVTLEIPGGLVEINDSPEGAAGRELYEETGFRASNIIPLGSVHPNPAILNNQCYTFLARDVYKAGDQQQDEKEDIEVLLQPLSEIPRLIKDGDITHSLVLVAFYRLFIEYGALNMSSAI
ncbi:MAG TPA: NUDIX hydrolase [Desulfobacteraceae bacterium]|nr:NUDIX hydrolase [Desulfobacteraceae bacterium]